MSFPLQEIHRLSLSEGRVQSEQLACIDTGTSAVMNSSVRPGCKAMACGMDETCAVVSVSSSANNSPVKGAARERRARRSSKTPESITVSIDTRKQSDFHEKYPLQKVVRFNAAGDTVATGGADGQIRLWQVTRHSCLRSAFNNMTYNSQVYHTFFNISLDL